MDSIDTLTPDIDALKKQRDAYLSAAAKLSAAINLLEGNAEKPIDWKNSALDCIRSRPYPIRTVDILNCMASIDPEQFNLKDTTKRRNYINALSIALNSLCDRGVLDRAQIPGVKGYFYGLKELFIDNNTLKPEVDKKLLRAFWTEKENIFNFNVSMLEKE